MPYKAHTRDLLEEKIEGVEKGTEREAETSPWGQEWQKRKREGGEREREREREKRESDGRWAGPPTF